MTLKTSEVLTNAKQLIDSPEKWIQGDFSNDNNTCFCALGAISEVLKIDPMTVYRTAAAARLKNSVSDSPLIGHWETFASYNYRADHAQVMDAFDSAIALSAKLGD